MNIEYNAASPNCFRLRYLDDFHNLRNATVWQVGPFRDAVKKLMNEGE